MSSATASNPTGARALALGVGDQLDEGSGDPPPMNPRQQELNHRWGYYRCVAEGSLVTAADGARVPIEQIARAPSVVGVRQMRAEASPVTCWAMTGEKEVSCLSLASGREVTLTNDHRLLVARACGEGPFSWARLQQVQEGDRIAVPRRLQLPGKPLDIYDASLMGYAVGDGYTATGTFQFTNGDPEVVAAFRVAADAMGLTVRRTDAWHYDVGCGGAGKYKLVEGRYIGPLRLWLEERALIGKTASFKRAPEVLFTASSTAVAAFIAALWDCDGSIHQNLSTATLVTVSEGLARDTVALLLRLGVFATVHDYEPPPAHLLRGRPVIGRHRAWHVLVTGDALRVFASVVPLAHSKKASRCQALLRRELRAGFTTDTIPSDWLSLIGERWRKLPEAQQQHVYNARQQKGTRRDIVRAIALQLDNEELFALADGDVRWDTVKAVTPAGVQRVYDLTAPGVSSFIADDVFVHNCQNYDARKVDWAGRQHLPHVEHELVAQSGFIPPGFYDAGQTLPLKFRRPTAPYYLGRAIVDRFTALLFSERRFPKFVVEGDPDTEDASQAMAEVGHLRTAMIGARNFGGAMGSVGMGFKFVDGLPVFEVHDPRWCMPEFLDPHTRRVARFEKRFAFPDYVRGPKGAWVQAWFWHRRYVDENVDVVWPKVPVLDGSEPDWDRWESYGAEHNYGFCPIVWIQNLPVEDDVDGDPDLLGAYDKIEAIDALDAQANKGVLSSCDPTLELDTDADFDEVLKGSDNAIKLEKGGSAKYLEITGSGPKAAAELAERFERHVLRVTRCVLEQQKLQGDKTATEIDRDYSSMIEKADIMRAQYGEKGLKPLMQMVLRAARKLVGTRIERDAEGRSQVVRSVLNLPKKVLVEEATGRATFTDRKLGPSTQLTLRWPQYFQPTVADTVQAVQSMALALTSGLVDEEHAVQYLAGFMTITDAGALVQKLIKEKAEASAQLQQQLQNRMTAGMTPNLTRVK